MCGIAGFLSSDPGGVEPAVRRMMRALVHRGPDDEGFERFPLGTDTAGPTVGFGFRRLAILDLSPLGHQPMVDAGTGNAIIFNGEIYNFVDLRRRLRSEGHEIRSTGDTEVLLRALSVWGERALEELDGMFALAFYHAASRRVLLARDPQGIKPLYVARLPGAILFASEVRALLASGAVPSDLDPAGIACYLAYGAPQDPLTIHRAIRSMAAGSFEWLDAGSLEGRSARLRRYWRFPDIVARAEAETAVVRRVRSLLEDSVRHQCIADVPLGVFLSGGIDSASMAALAVGSQGIASTFAVGYQVAGVIDETGAAAESAAVLGTHHFQTIVDDDWVMLQWSEWLKAADRPSIDGLNTYIVSGAVRDRDITVALSGLGADELFGGYPTFRQVPRLQKAMRAISWIPRGMRRAAAASLLAWLPAGKRAKVIDLLSNGSSAIELTALGRRALGDKTLRTLGFQPQRLNLSPAFLPAEAYDAFTPTRDAFAAVAEAEACLYMGNTLLRDSDINSMAHSLELRVPFLGRRIFDYVSSLPGRVRSPQGSLPKHLLRRALADSLPPSVFDRPKQGFGLPLNDWMFGPLRDQCEAAIDTIAACPLMDEGKVRQTWKYFRDQRKQIYWSRPLTLVALGSYLRRIARLSQDHGLPT
jgi:asparagine synthase (glutamine-hydrolysing)